MTKNSLATADAADRHRTFAAIAALALALMFLTNAVTDLVGPPAVLPLKIATLVLALLAVGLVVPVMFWKFRRMPAGERDLYFNADGFVPAILNRALRASWVVTLLLLMVLNVLVGDNDSGGYLSSLPAEFFLQVALAVMLGVKAVVFLVLSRDDSEDGGEDGARA